jgi:hypothetical protein
MPSRSLLFDKSAWTLLLPQRWVPISPQTEKVPLGTTWTVSAFSGTYRDFCHNFRVVDDSPVRITAPEPVR